VFGISSGNQQIQGWSPGEIVPSEIIPARKDWSSRHAGKNLSSRCYLYGHQTGRVMYRLGRVCYTIHETFAA